MEAGIVAMSTNHDAPDCENSQCDSTPNSENRLEWLCRWVTQLTTVALILLIAVEVFMRAVFGQSLQVTDELGGYALVVIAFVSLPSCHAQGAFHHVHLLDARLSAVSRTTLQCLFDLVSLGAAGVLLWQFVLFTLRTWESGDVAATMLMTPLWIPRTIMCVGAGCLCLSLLRTLLVDCRYLVKLSIGRDGSR